MIKGKLIQYGFDPSLVKITPDNWTLGSLAPVVLIPDGNWENFLPVFEKQYGNGWDSFGCTIFGGTTQIEILQKFLEGKETNYAERYNYNLIGIEPPGANPHEFYQSVRHEGLLAQEELPFPPTLAEFKSPRPMTEELKNKGKKWLLDWDFNHSWLISPSHELIANKLKFGPIAVAVTAWFFQDGLAVDANQPNSHWCVAFKAYPDGRIDIFDSYDNSVKILHPEHKISFAKEISLLNKKKVIESLKNLPEIKDYKNGNHYWNLVKKAVQFIIDILTFWK